MHGLPLRSTGHDLGAGCLEKALARPLPDVRATWPAWPSTPLTGHERRSSHHTDASGWTAEVGAKGAMRARQERAPGRGERLTGREVVGAVDTVAGPGRRPKGFPRG